LGMGSDLVFPHGGYRRLRSFQVARGVYDATVIFCRRFVYEHRMKDQMVQAARSGVQNIAEGSAASATSKKTEIKLTNVARASLEELLLDYEDFLRQRGLEVWDKDSQKAQTMRQRLQRERILNLPPRPDEKPQLTGLAEIANFINLCEPEIAANTMICLINQASFLLGRQINRLEADFLNTGGFTERLYKKRIQFRETKKSDASDSSERSDKE
jgi:restriction system protein